MPSDRHGSSVFAAGMLRDVQKNNALGPRARGIGQQRVQLLGGRDGGAQVGRAREEDTLVPGLAQLNLRRFPIG